MNKIRVLNFGPIRAGYHSDGGWMTINKVTVFIGNQGSGKSTVAKVISTMTWLEKALVRGDFGEKELTAGSLFRRHFSYQNVDSYFNDDTIIEYQGRAYHISYKNKAVLVHKVKGKDYVFPKIMYVPSERNFVSSVRNVNKLKGLPSTLYTFSDEFLDAVGTLKGQVELPINKVKFEYQKLNELSWIVGEDYKIKLSEASSGFQSFVPLFIVSSYLAESLNKESDNATKEISIEQERRIRKQIQDILTNPNLSDEVKKNSLEFLSSRTTYSAFINIVEEPEQNLFPTSQHHILNSLLRINKENDNNSLVITTHSPYIINYLSVAIEAGSVLATLNSDALKNKLEHIVPANATVKADDVCIYQLDEARGSITDLPKYEGIPSDRNYLNESLAEGNKLFDSLLELQQEQ